MLSEKTIKEFQKIYKETFCKELDKKDVREKTRQLLNLFKVIYKPKEKNYEDS